MAQQQRWMKALDTFVGTMPDGSECSVVKGEPRPDSDAVVKQWPGLFDVMDPGAPDKPPAVPESEAKAEAPKGAPAVKEQPVKASPARGTGKTS